MGNSFFPERKRGWLDWLADSMVVALAILVWSAALLVSFTLFVMLVYFLR